MIAWLLSCPAASPEQGRMGRVLAGLLLILILLTLVATTTMLLAMVRIDQLLSNVAMLAAFLILYATNRRGRITRAGVGLILVLMAVIAYWGLATPVGVLSSGTLLIALIIAVALAGILFSWRGVLAVTVGVTVELGLLLTWGLRPLHAYAASVPQDALGAVVGLVTTVWSVAALAAFTSMQMHQALARLETQHEVLMAQSSRERSLLVQMLETAGHIQSTAAAIAATAAQQADGAHTQAEAITSVTGTVEELNATAAQIADSAVDVSAAVTWALASAEHGQAAVDTSMAGIERLTERINEIVARNQALSTQSARINEILATISEIAAQTHILALNAAIESASAGAFGARFAVVAGEVKRLAQHSSAATREVQEILQQNEEALAAAAQATEEGLREGTAGRHLAEQSRAANTAIIAEVERTAELAQEIQQATEQQRRASEQAVESMRGMVGITQQVAASSRELLAAVQQLSAVAQALGRVEAPPPAPTAPIPGPSAVAPPPRPADQFVPAIA